MRRRQFVMMGVVIAVSVGLIAQPPRGRGRGGMGPGFPMADLAEKLKLDETQTKVWEAIRTELETSTESTRAHLRELREQGAGPEDEAVVGAREEMRKAFTKAEKDLLDILTDEQKSQYEELKKSAQSERHRGRGMGGRRGGSGESRGGGGGF